ncbi:MULTISPECIES: TMEM43 family protein [Rhodanobacter]|uniref:DUF2207 domain-containing protein n=1 Tax=Rhodanobacter hydrolyticus TaxID=2250595 RepID=A0ABW8JB07_9GAMM|nr:TMEM43 family protein [Rhodanobacter sp. 7MK24]MBD8882044.1 hypothetical protein [Rhodanobacter sp. 7MK24]
MRIDTVPRSVLAVAGVVLLAMGIVLAASTERGLAGYRVALQLHGGEVLDLGSDAEPQPDLQGRMVRISGTPHVVAQPLDADFNQQADTPVLTRRVQMFQWRELRLGGDATYELDWSDTPQDASQFVHMNGHINPGAFPIPAKRFVAESVQLGGFMLDAKLVQDLPGSEPVAPNVKALPENLAATFSLYDGALVTSIKPGDPRLGDLRVSWNAAPLQEITVIARVDGDHLVPALDAADGKGYEVDVGNSALIDMRPDMAAQPGLTWLRRVLAVLLATLGVGLLLSRNARRADPLAALGGGLFVAGAVAAIPWLGGSTPAVAAWFVAAAIGLGLLLWRRRRRHH